MKRFTLNWVEISIFIFLLTIFILSSLLLVRKHYEVIKDSYTISKLNQNVRRSRERIETLKVHKARIVTPHYLEHVSGRGGYSLPKQEQIILLNSQEDEP